MPGWQIPGVPPVPTMADLVRAMQLQAEVLAELPQTVADLSRVVRGLAETVEVTTDAANNARQVIERLEGLLDDLQDPLRGLRPGVERLGTVLNDPAVDRIPAVVEALERTVLPVTSAADRMRDRLAVWTERRNRALSYSRRVALRLRRHQALRTATALG